MSPVRNSSPRPVTGVLPYLDGLRGVAVLLVLLYHARVGLDGGYVGVDVFLVLSGFLVTSLLLGEHDAGGVSLAGFWTRRIRRLLPVSSLVVVVTAIAGFVLLEPQRLDRLAGDVFGVATFSANVRFLGTHGDYLGGLSLPSPLLHFWSLALEEQFYVLWPVLLVVVLRAARRAATPERSLAAVAGGLLVCSFLASSLLTLRHPAFAYYLLPTRAWELLSGALLALCWGPLARRFAASDGAGPSRLRDRVRSVSGAAGLVVLVVASAVFDSSTVFPGSAAAVPVLATLAVLFAGDRSLSGRVLSVGALRWLGVRSYGAYLWHWPILVFAGALGRDGSVWVRVALLGVSIVVADVSFRLLESPVRTNAWLAVAPRRSALLGGGMAAALCVVALLVQGAAVAPVGGVSRVGQSGPGGRVGVPRNAEVPSTAAPAASKGAAGARVLLLGDSTLAPLRWFADGTSGLARWGSSVEFVLDAESCRRLSMRSCLGREDRVPESAAEVLSRPGSAGERFRFVVLMAGYHSTPEEFAEEFDAVMAAAASHGVEKVFVLEYRESLAFPLDGSRGEVSVFRKFNEAVDARAAVRTSSPELVVLRWNSFSAVADDWFRSDGIHVNLAGALGLGEFISRGVLSDLRLPCGPLAVCVPVPAAVPAADVLFAYGVEATDEHCYAMGESRVPECRRDRLR